MAVGNDFSRSFTVEECRCALSRAHCCLLDYLLPSGALDAPFGRDYFDALGLFSERQHTLSVRALTHCDLYKLTREHFESVVADYPAQGLAIIEDVVAILQDVLHPCRPDVTT